MQHQSIAKKLFQFAIIAGLAITIYSCTDNGQASGTTNADSTGRKMDTMTTSSGMNSQDTMMNMNDSNNVQRHGQ